MQDVIDWLRSRSGTVLLFAVFAAWGLDGVTYELSADRALVERGVRADAVVIDTGPLRKFSWTEVRFRTEQGVWVEVRLRNERNGQPSGTACP